MNEFTDEQKQMLQNMGALGYPPEKISSIMNLTLNEVEKEFKDEKSELKKLYLKGADYANYLIDFKLFELAQKGDIRAIDKLEARKRELNKKKK